MFKILFLVAAVQLFFVLREPKAPTILFMLPIVFFSLFETEEIIVNLIYIPIMSALVYGYFWLLTRYETGLESWSILLSGALAIIFIL